jgi:hypothetical protein
MSRVEVDPLDATIDALRSEETDLGQADLMAVVQSNGEFSALSLAAFMEAQEANSSRIEGELIDLALDFAEQHAGEDVALRLLRSHVLALFRAGEVSEALRFADREISSDALRSILPPLLEQVLSAGQSGEILMVADWARRNHLIPEMPSEDRLKVAEAVLKASLPKLVMEFIDPVGELSQDERRLLRETFVHSREYLRAIEVTVGEVPDDLEQSREQAELFLRLGDFENAWNAVDGSEAEDLASDIAWNARRWSYFGGSGPRQQVVGNIAANNLAEDADLPITNAKNLVEESAATRAAISALLAGN